jgi:hypothetical protein
MEWSVWMRSLIKVVMSGLLIGPAYGQSGPSSNPSDPPIGTPSKNREEKNKLDPKKVDAEYNAAMKRSRVTTPKAVSDPWQNVRTPSPSSDKK